ncbi:thiamine-phosphate kinase [Aestuariirhabdus sp. Z084]|uniref:thiamine-phosphate kinase n=1 Tax=Aestuariirhabdus haliotis TaxID=2918751 RepID=UPI00201B458B|nr:thiamine-phosphate kinase [Aestuariirhabdus haliotis]MCL6415059.1 thiamine-phosphate kinase [Aestuariirhabdus haliotis]MCL6418991.1 thiamine-phosphate kinase [Aestuariirhabdus haliotis]
MPGEFELIRRYFDRAGLADPHPDVVLGIGDDCAIIEPPSQHQLCFSVDTLVADVHFPASADPTLIARRALAINLSDLAAMGATPLCFTLAISLPEADTSWLQAFSEGLASEATQHGICLVGGDTTRGPLSLTLQVQGALPRGQSLRRDGARIGDLILVSGTLGDGAGALDYLDAPANELDCHQRFLLQRYYQPQPRLQLGQQLLAMGGRSGIDISDGLLADLGHLLERSGLGAEVNVDALPLSSALQALRPDQAQSLALSGGDDYELCFTLPETLWNQHKASLCALVSCTPIGHIRTDTGLRDANGKPLVSNGYQHF